MDEKLSNMPEQDQNQNTDAAADNSYQQTTSYGYYGENAQGSANENNGMYQQNFNQNSNMNYNQGYQQNYNPNYNGNMGKAPLDAPLTMGQWLLTILAGLVPCLGIVLYCVWAFGANTNINRKNYSRAMLIVQAVIMVVYVLFFVVFGIAMSSSLYY